MKRFLLILTLQTMFFPGYAASGGESEYPYSPRLVKIERENEIDSLQSEGVEILRRRGDILLCLFPNVQTRSDAATRRPLKPIAPTLDKAKEFYSAGSIQTGDATGTPYTGKGVVVGLCDIGIDPLHPTFLDREGKSRIKRVVQYVEREGIRLQLEGDDEYRDWVTDNPEEYHATHVCGILAGNGAGTPYAGVATDAEIVATVSTLTEVGLLAGVEDIIDYAKEVGKPAVINISVGSYTGAHDGSSLFSRYLDMAAEEAVIVLSSGNEGSHNNSLFHEFSNSKREVPFILGDKSWLQLRMYGATDIWSGDSSPLQVRLGLYDLEDRKMVKWLDYFSLTGYETTTYSWGGGSVDPDSFPFEGELIALGYVDPENGRHCTSLGYEFTSPETASSGGWAKYVLAVEVGGEPGNDVEVYSDGIYTRLVRCGDGPIPTSSRSISDLACGFNVISVGMYGNRDFIPVNTWDGMTEKETEWESTGYNVGATVVPSSYGTLRDGRVTPLTTAPGATLMSAGSRPYFYKEDSYRHLRANGTSWVDEGGTSMSAPYVAGYIATWLEAVPTLTPTDIRRIIAESNRMDIPETSDPRNANGYFDPVKGLKLALKAGGVESADSNLDDYVEAYDMTGVKRYAGKASGLSGIGSGVYVVRTPGGVYKKVIN